MNMHSDSCAGPVQSGRASTLNAGSVSNDGTSGQCGQPLGMAPDSIKTAGCGLFILLLASSLLFVDFFVEYSFSISFMPSSSP